MAKNIVWSLILVSILLAALPSAYAQSYSTIDGELGLYCADLPDGTNALVNVTRSNGLYITNTLDSKAEIAKIVKLRKTIQQRISALNGMKRDYDPSADGTKLRQIYKFVANEIINDVDNDDSLDNTKPSQIYKKLSALISQLKLRLKDLQYAIETIERCLRNEDLIPPPQAISSEVIYFPFTHPDYRTTEWMRGIGVTAILHKKRSTGVVCVSSAKSGTLVNKFPKETAMSVWKNPCLLFWQRTFRNYPFCHYGVNQHTAVGWLGSTNVGFSQSAVDEDDIAQLQRKLDGHAPIIVRAPTKKKPCRTK